MVFFNLMGLAWLIISVVFGFAIAVIFKPANDMLSIIAVPAMLFVIDMAHRYFILRPKLNAEYIQTKRDKGLSKVMASQIWFISNHGGNLMLLPAWLFSIVFAAFFIFY